MPLDNASMNLRAQSNPHPMGEHRGFQIPDGLSAQVHAGQSYLIEHSQARSAPPLDMDVGAWAEGLIVARNMRLADFLKEVGRYRHGFIPGRFLKIALPGVLIAVLSGTGIYIWWRKLLARRSNKACKA